MTKYTPDPKRLAQAMAIKAEMDNIKGRFVGVAAPPRIKLRDELKKLLVDKNIPSQRRVKATRMAVNMKNRFGQGVVPTRPHKLLDDISGEGFSLAELDDGWAVEAPPKGTLLYEALHKWNQQICSMSSGILPLYADDMEASSLTCTNTNQSCRIVLQAAPSDHNELSENGYLSLDLLKKKDELYAQHCVDGLPWNVIPYEVEYLYPWVPELFQEAGNTTQVYTEASTRLEVMLSILKLAQRSSEETDVHSGNEFWQKIQIEAERGSRVPFAGEIPHFVTFLKKMSGGIDNPHLFMEYWAFLLTLKTKAKNIMGPIYSAIAEVESSKPICRSCFGKPRNKSNTADFLDFFIPTPVNDFELLTQRLPLALLMLAQIFELHV